MAKIAQTKDHGLDKVGFDHVQLARSTARSTDPVSGHHPRLTTDRQKNAPVAEHEDQKYDDVEGEKVPDPVHQLGGLALEEHQTIALALCLEEHQSRCS